MEAFLTAFEGATVLLASLDEGRKLSRETDLQAIADDLTRFAETVVLTLGADGALVAGHGLVPAAPADVVDPTGAGDAFAAGFLDQWVHSRDAVAGARAGAALAARAVTVVGGRPA
jgi:sugar/nucleoside kinase (ribokinase family)